MTIATLLDLFLAGALVVSAYRAVHARELFTGVVLYVVFGLLLALVWVRLEAPDLAIAEAAIGAGITGAMLLGAARQMGSAVSRASGAPGRDRLTRAVAALAAGGIAAGLAVLFLQVAEPNLALAARVAGRLDESGVTHPVTAVLLNFRGYDTWLETGVLLIAAIAVSTLRRRDGPAAPAGTEGNDVHASDSSGAPGASGVAIGAADVLAPLGVLVAGYLVWRGSHAPGGAFQAGAVLAAIIVLLVLLDRSPLDRLSPPRQTLFLVLGFGAFLGIGSIGVLQGRAFLTFPAGLAGLAILVIETAIAISVGVTLALLFAEGRADMPSGYGPDEAGRETDE